MLKPNNKQNEKSNNFISRRWLNLFGCDSLPDEYFRQLKPVRVGGADVHNVFILRRGGVRV